MRPKIPVVHATGITLLLLALTLLLFLSSSAGNSDSRAAPSAPGGLNPGPDVIMGEIRSLQQFGSSGTQVGLAMGTDSCNAGDQELNFFAMPNTDHPVMAQNLYRMSGGTAHNERFEQIGQSWITHGFFALQQNACNFGCAPASGGTHLGVGCSNADSASINAGPTNLGSRAWVNPFTGLFPSTANSHTGHAHTDSSHRILVEGSDLNTTLNPDATYYAESQYITPHEYAWCQDHAGQCNMANNASYRQFNVAGTTSFVFSAIGSTVRMTPAINAWPGATVKTIEPAPGIDGRAFLAYKVTGPVGGIWHYEYAIYNQNLDRGIQSFSVPTVLAPKAGDSGDIANNVGFHAPPQHPGFANDGTQGNLGFSNAPWTTNQSFSSLTWSSETIILNENANAIRWGTLYNFRFDSNRPPLPGNATIGFFKTGAPITVEILAPAPVGGTPTPTPIPTATHFEVIAPPVVVMFNGFNFTVRALDQFNNTVTSYAGTVHFTTTATLHLLPPDGTLINGFRTFSADLLSEGIQTITATDTVNPSITGMSNNILVLSDQPTPPPTPTPACTPLPPTTQGFEDVSVLVSNGWHMQNNSQPGPGSTGWFQGNSAVFPAQSGPAASYIGANFTNGTGISTISNWLLTPQIPLRNGMVMTFWTRTISTPTFPDRLQVRMSTNGASTNVGTTATEVGDFTRLFLDVNPTYSTTVYPNSWAFGIVTINGLASDTTGRLAFRYFVENGGPGGPNSDYIGIDNIQIYPGCPGFFIPTPTPGPPAPTLSPAPTPRPTTTTPTPPPTPFPEPAVQFAIIAPAKWDVNVPLSFGVIAQNMFGNIDPNYAGTVHFTSSDPMAVLPADSTLTKGTGIFTATFHTAGSQTITATDTQSFITGTSNPIKVIGSPPTPTPTATPEPTPTPTPTPGGTATPTPPSQALNLSTRLRVQTGDNAGIGGFIITGTGPKHLLIRGIGPSLTISGITDALANPTLDLRDSAGVRILANNDWRETQEAEIIATGIPPTDDLEAAIVETLEPGSYTVILRGMGMTNGVGLVEIYDLDDGANSKLANLSTRAFVSAGNNVVIAGFILGGAGNDRVVVRGIGPSLTAAGVANALLDPTLELRDSDGTLVVANSDWQDDPDQAAQLTAAGLAPTNNLESGVAAALLPGLYTAVLAGLSDGMGVGLIEVYDLGTP